MDLRRLTAVQDFCPLPGSPFRSLSATHWMGRVANSYAPIIYHGQGYTIAVSNNPFLTWHRTFTQDHHVPEPPKRPAIITIHEWIPATQPRDTTGWKQFGSAHKEGIAYLKPGEDFTKNWSSHARRHLNVFRKQAGVTLRYGTLREVHENIAVSQVPKAMQQVFLDVLERHLLTQPETIDILIAESETDGILAGFVSGNVEEIKQSYYLTGFFRPAAAKTQAMTGLIEWWFRRALELGYESVNFGHMCGPNPPFIDPAVGYSNFKTHFGINRVWMPGSYWKIKFRNPFT